MEHPGLGHFLYRRSVLRSEFSFKEQSQTYELINTLAKQSPDLRIHDPHLVNESGSDVLFEDRDPVELVLSCVRGNDPATLGRVHPHRIGHIYGQQTLVTQVTLMNKKLALIEQEPEQEQDVYF